MADPPTKSAYSLRSRAKKAEVEPEAEEVVVAAPAPKKGVKSAAPKSGRAGAGAGAGNGGVSKSVLSAIGAPPSNTPYASLRVEGRNIVYPYLANLTTREAEMIFTGGRGFEGLPSPPSPFFVLLFGSPGSGKSTALARLPELIGEDPNTAVQISLDALVESLEPFRQRTSKIATNILVAKAKAEAEAAAEEGKSPEDVEVFIDLNATNGPTIGEIGGKTSGIYVSYMKSAKNNRPGHEKNSLEMSLNDMRFTLLTRALADGKNIVYERTISSVKEDTLQEEVFAKIAASGRPYRIFVIYTKIDDPEVLGERLRRRPIEMMKRNPPFFRGVPPFLAGKFIKAHEDYFVKYLLPRRETVQLIVVPWNADVIRIPMGTPGAAPAASTSTSTGNARRGGNRKNHTRKRKGSCARKTRRS